MFRNTFLVFISTILLSFLFLSSCNETTILENKICNGGEKIFKKDNEGGLLKETKKDVKIIGYKIVIENGKEKKVPIYDGNPNGEDDPKALNCDYYSRYVYEFSHYESNVGKWLGVWDGYNKIGYINAYEKWGFTKYYVSSESVRNLAVNSGFDPDNIMATVHTDNFAYWLTSGTYKSYHIDEVLERGHLSREQVTDLANMLDEDYYNATLFMSSYKIESDYGDKCDDYDYILDNTQNTFMVCDQYYDASIWYGNDQRPYWTWFKNHYGSNRVKSHWISLDIDGDQGDFNRLFVKRMILA